MITPLVQALDDPSVAVAGAWGITSSDLRTFEDAPPGDVDAIEGYLLAFRRGDADARGPLDERLRSTGTSTSGGASSCATRAKPRSHAGPFVSPTHRRRVTSIAAGRASPTRERARQSKRNFYRIIDRFDRSATYWSARLRGDERAPRPGAGPRGHRRTRQAARGRHPHRGGHRRPLFRVVATALVDGERTRLEGVGKTEQDAGATWRERRSNGSARTAGTSAFGGAADRYRRRRSLEPPGAVDYVETAAPISSRSASARA